MPSARRPVSVFLLSAALATVAPDPVRAHELRLVKDLGTAGAGNRFEALGVDRDVSYFAAYSPDFGAELWRSDGTPERTSLLVDIWPGPASSSPVPLVEAGGVYYFLATDARAGRELWKTDGTVEGTVRVKDISPGQDSTWNSVYAKPVAVAAGDLAFFEISYSESAENGLWVTDGSAAGTYRLASLRGGLASIAGGVFFGGWDEENGCQLWTSDGSVGGTRRIRAIGRGDSCPSMPVDFRGLLFFAAADTEHGREPWISDGSEAGTRLLKDIVPGFDGSEVSGCSGYDEFEPVQLGDRLFFSARDDRHGCEVWVTDGTEQGTRLFLDAAPPASSRSLGPSVSLGDRFLFHSYGRLFVSDGTEEGTSWLSKNGDWVRATFASGAEATRSPEGFLERLLSSGLAPDGSGRRAFFREVVYSSKWGTDYDLWITDGTRAETRRLGRVAPPAYPTQWPWPQVNGLFVFPGDDSEEGGLLGVELWTAGVDGGPSLPLYDIMPGGRSSEPDFLAHLGERILFSAQDGVHGREIWVTDGSYEGTELVLDINDGNAGGVPDGLVELDGVIYFAAGLGDLETYESGDSHHAAGRELWRTDGTAAGTYLVRDIRPGGWSSEPSNLTVAGDRLYFGADSGTHSGLWVTDGTRDGTRAVEEATYVENLLGTRKQVFFTRSSWRTCALWRSDGVTTEFIKEIEEGFDACRPLGPLGNVVFFWAEGRLWRTNGRARGTFALPAAVPEGVTGETAGDLFYFHDGERLWVTDGSVSGTRRLYRDFIRDLIPSGVGDGVFFLGNDGVNGNNLSFSDGTRAGTRVVKEFRPAGDDVYIAQVFAAVEGTAFFTVTANKERSGYEAWLWKSDGTAAGTMPVAPLPWRPNVGEHAAVGKTVFFGSEEPTTGGELWQTDGTRRGTRIVADLNPGRESSFPSDLTVVGDTLYFVASRGRDGRELWALEAGGNPVARLPKLLSVPDDDGGGDEEVAVLGAGLRVLDAGSGVVISEGPFAPSDQWEAIDFEWTDDANGNGSTEVVVLARKRNKTRIYVVDGLTGAAISSVNLGRRDDPLELEIMGHRGGAGSAVVLSRRGLGGPARVSTEQFEEGSRFPNLAIELPREFDARDVEVVELPGESGGGGGRAVVVLGRMIGRGGPRVLVFDAGTGGPLGDWELDSELVPVDLEPLGLGASSAPRVVVLGQRPNGASAILTIDPTTGELVAKRRLKRKVLVLDLESMPGEGDTRGSKVGVLWVSTRDRRSVGISTSNALTGRKLETARLTGIGRPRDLAFARTGRRGKSRVAVLADAACGGRGDRLEMAVTLWDLESGQRLGCYPVE